MNNNKIAFGVGLLAVLLASAGLFRPLNVNVAAPNVNLGGSSGTEHSNLEHFAQGIIQGGDVLAFTAPVALTAEQVCTASRLQFNGAAVSTTVPTARALIDSCLRAPGDKLSIFGFASTTADFTILENTSTSVLNASGSLNIITATQGFWLDIVRTTSGTVSQPWVTYIVSPIR